MQKKTYSYLALGDSYTIGEGVATENNFPNQTARLLSQAGYSVDPPLIIAKTGWTTEELQRGISNRLQQPLDFDFVSLLIGVNNQYSGSDPNDYAKQFEELLQQAVQFAGKNPSQVFVLSIPDWGVTPYAEGRNRALIAKEIDSFNRINKEISTKYKVNYIEITDGTRKAATDHSLLAEDKLHPSEKEYKRWAAKLASRIQQQLQ